MPLTTSMPATCDIEAKQNMYLTFRTSAKGLHFDINVNEEYRIQLTTNHYTTFFGTIEILVTQQKSSLLLLMIMAVLRA